MSLPHFWLFAEQLSLTKKTHIGNATGRLSVKCPNKSKGAVKSRMDRAWSFAWIFRTSL